MKLYYFSRKKIFLKIQGPTRPLLKLAILDALSKHMVQCYKTQNLGKLLPNMVKQLGNMTIKTVYSMSIHTYMKIEKKFKSVHSVSYTQKI